MDIDRHMAAWRKDAMGDMEVAGVILRNGRYAYALFTAHLAIEKLLKVFIMAKSSELPPRIHNLSRLASLSGLTISAAHEDALRRLEMFQIAGRYPGGEIAGIGKDEAVGRLEEAQELFQWLSQQ